MNSKRSDGRQATRRRSRRSRKSLALVFALVFAPAAARQARAECVPFTTPPAISLTADLAQCVFLADVDGDGDLDAVSASSGDSKIAWYVNENGDGSLWSLHTISTAAYGERVVVAADIDGDGDLDVLAAGGAPKFVAWNENLAPGDGSSWTRHVISTNANLALDVDAADLDGDGDLDAITASRFDDKIAWYENLAPGDGSTWSTHDIATDALFASSTAPADVDGDGDLDLVYTAYSADVLGWFENSDPAGDASTWAQHAIYTANDGPYHVVAADVDGDGDLDAVAAFLSTGKVAWLENLTPGDGSSWTLHTITTLAPSTQRVATADVDADGDADVLVPSYSDDKVAWHENLGQGAAWAIHTLSTSADAPQWVVAGDLDGDGDLDLASASQNDDTIAWYTNDGPHGTALFGGAQTVSQILYAVAVRAGDLDRDGDVDLVAPSVDADEVFWFANDGGGAGWSVTVVDDGANGALFAAPADVDGDGDLDVVSASGGNRTAWHENVDLTDSGTGDGSSWSLHTVSTATNSVNQLATADVDGDGDLDLLSASAAPGNSLLAWHRNDDPYSLAPWSLTTISAALDQVTSVVASDLDRDGDLDAVASITGAPERISWFENTHASGDGSTWSERTIAATADPENVVVGDVDRDGDDDVVAALAGGAGGVVWYENPRGAGTWTAHTAATASPLLWSTDVAVTDFDRDGDLDLLAASFYLPRVAWIENLDGAGTSWTSHALSTVDDVTHLVAADLDGDGDDDAAVVSRDGDRLDWYENRSSHLFTNGFGSETPESANLTCWSGNVP